MELKKRKYNELDYLRFPLKAAPFWSVLKILMTVLTALLPSLNVLIAADFVDTAISVAAKNVPTQAIYTPLALIAASVLYVFFSGILAGVANFNIGRRLTVTFRNAVVKKRGSLDYRYIEDNDTWDLISRTAGGCEGKIMSGFDNIMQIAQIALSAVSLVGLVYAYSPISGLMLTLLIVPTFFLAVKNGRREYDAWKDAEKIRRKSYVLGAALVGREYVEERSTFGYSRKIDERWHALYEQARKVQLKATVKAFLNNHGLSILALVAGGVSMGFMLYDFFNGKFSAGSAIGLLTGILSLVQLFSWQLSMVIQNFASTREYLADFTRFCALDDENGALDKPSANTQPVESIEFRNVTFAYPGTETEILKNLSFTLSGNKTYAFVGVNGAGKTTIIKLLTGLYHNYTGEILINGKDIKEYSYAQLKSFFSVVYQDFAKYEVSLRECVELGNVNGADESRAKEAIEAIDLENELGRFEHGLDTNLGKTRPDGTDISGGQWQRIALARSLVSDATVRILDEPTSALDPIAEAQIYELFGRTGHSVLTLLITHRLGAARMSDEILVLADGAVVECGPHDELMTRHGVYEEMFEAQRSWYYDV